MKKIQSISMAGLILGVGIYCSAIWADAPVVDLSQNSSTSSSASTNTTSNTSNGSSNVSNDMSAASGLQGINPNTLNSSLPSLQSLTMEQRTARLEQQMNNLVRMNLPQQISQLQQKLQQLTGQLQVQAHDLKVLNSQQRSFYQDLDQRINQIKNLQGSSPEATGTTGDTNDTSAKPKPTSLNNDIPSTSSSVALKSDNAYQAAFQLLSKKKYDDALAAMQNYLSDYPNGKYNASAHYWLGELYLIQKKLPQASQEFTTVVKNFPKNSKYPDAKLKLAVIAMKQRRFGVAKAEFQQIKKHYPGTTAAQLAAIQLQTIATKSRAKNVSTQ